MDEFDRAVEIATRVLDWSGDEPDHDLTVLARQFLCAIERDARLLSWWRMEGSMIPVQQLSVHIERDIWHKRLITVIDPEGAD